VTGRERQTSSSRYLPAFRMAPFYRTSSVLISLPLAIQIALYTWLAQEVPGGNPSVLEVVGLALAWILILAVVVLRLRSVLGGLHRETLRISFEEGPSKRVDEVILGLYRLPRKLLALEIPLALILLVPLTTLTARIDGRLVEPVLVIPACMLPSVIPSYTQTLSREVHRVVRFMPHPTRPGVLEGRLQNRFLLGGALILLPMGIALWEVYRAGHVLLLEQGGTSLNIVAHMSPLPVLACLVVIAALSASSWWIGRRTGESLQGISRYFEEAFGDESAPSTPPVPAMSGTPIAEARRLEETTVGFAGRLEEIRTTQRRMIEGLEQAQRIKTVFLASMSHDLKSPLNSIIGFSELLLRGMEGELNPGQKEDVRLIHASGEELLHLINNILDSARLEAGRLELHKEWTPSVELVSSVVKSGMQEIGTKRIVFESEIQPGLPPVFVDPHRISQAVGNLISNAIKFMEEGEVHVRAHVHKTDESPPRRFLRIDVTDTGAGIREEDRDRIFEAFQQLDRSYSRRSSGMGLGLTLTKKLVDLHDGKLTLTSRLGEGSTFSISLPMEE